MFVHDTLSRDYTPTYQISTDGRQRQPNHNTTKYCVYWPTTTMTTQWYPSVNTICGRIMIGLLLLSISKHNMWSCYDWVRCCLSVNTIYGRILIGLSLSSVGKHTIIRPHIMFTDGWQRQPNHNVTTYCVYWRTTTTTTQSFMIVLLFSVSKHNMWSHYDWVVVVFRQ
jgi:hypothetical protein